MKSSAYYGGDAPAHPEPSVLGCNELPCHGSLQTWQPHVKWDSNSPSSRLGTGSCGCCSPLLLPLRLRVVALVVAVLVVLILLSLVLFFFLL